MDDIDLVVVFVGVICAGILGYMLGYNSATNEAKALIYQACETAEPLVLEINRVRQVYHCERAK